MKRRTANGITPEMVALWSEIRRLRMRGLRHASQRRRSAYYAANNKLMTLLLGGARDPGAWWPDWATEETPPPDVVARGEHCIAMYAQARELFVALDEAWERHQS